MLRSDAASLYGWDIVLRGTLWPGPRIGRRCAEAIRAAALAGHEIGFHAWDHHAWQARVDRLSSPQVAAITARGVEALTAITGAAPTAAAAPGWRCTDAALRAQAAFPFAYQSDCRGESIFLPRVRGETLQRPQIPVTLPTYDEWIGRDGVTDANYNERLLARLDPLRARRAGRARRGRRHRAARAVRRLPRPRARARLAVRAIVDAAARRGRAAGRANGREPGAGPRGNCRLPGASVRRRGMARRSADAAVVVQHRHRPAALDPVGRGKPLGTVGNAVLHEQHHGPFATLGREPRRERVEAENGGSGPRDSRAHR
jgi:peptidoglycan/xylan/chitin deacetylase (PgdA/CDA1 family)